jgi:cellulose synthase/poly-beta-1,6-N-acetylglucosamine synthase-like glycosyltransferase
MNPYELAIAAVFWTSGALVVYAYLGYPALIWWASRRLGRKSDASPGEPEAWPEVTLLIAAHNEQDVIEERVRNALAMDYPRDRLKIVIGLDGCSDGTAAIVRQFEEHGVRLLDFDERRGKASVLNAAIDNVECGIVMMSDANTGIDPQAARRLVRWFQDSRVGAVVGRLILTDPRSGSNADGLYWKYETFLKRCEGRLGALLGANGAIYAIRRELYVAIPPETIIDDFVIPLLAKLRSGCSIVYDCDAVAREETPSDISSEFHRRARIGAGGFQSIGLLWRLLDPRRGWVAFTFLSHKVLRWLCPFFLVGLLGTSAVLVHRPFFRWVFEAQVAGYSLSLLSAVAPSGLRMPRIIRLMGMFTSMNAALLVGFIRWISNRQSAAWRRTTRVGEPRGVLR